MIKIADYYSEKEWGKYLEFSKKLKTPCIIIDLNIIKESYQKLIKSFPFSKVYYAMKANSLKEILELLKSQGSNFDTASIYELDLLLSLDVSPDRISYGNTIKTSQNIEYFYQKGVRLFVTDCLWDLNNIAKYAPKSKVFFRLLVESDTAEWPLSRKFGCHPDTAIDLIKKAKELELIPYGISFHVGSQQRYIGEWGNCLSTVKYVFDQALSEGIQLKMVNLGGGLPANYYQKPQNLDIYASEITDYLKTYLSDYFDNFLEVIIEPGRSLVANAGILITQVIMAQKKKPTDSYQWLYLDAGKFNGLIETIDESIKYPIVTDQTNTTEQTSYILAGPTCDSYDVMYEKIKYQLPSVLEEGDRLYWLSTGAYTYSYASVCFNGFPPIKCYCIS